MEGAATADPTRGEMRTRMITKAIIALPSGELRPVTVGDNSSTFSFHPQIFFSSPDDALSKISDELATFFSVNPVSASEIAQRMVAFALAKIRVGGDVRFGLSMSTVLENTIQEVISLSETMERFESVINSFGLVPESIGGEGVWNISDGGDSISTGQGLSETEVSRLKMERFNGENKNGEDAEVCSVCLDQYKEGDVITLLKPSCLHRFHKECIVSWLGKNRTCPVCRSRVAV
ncbi:unnamed protein product [Cuscuta europaea]|uniref:RING-type domain-containing protein n=1 Tax=Cuscuta europaea TaxID=41803 RepID=A0A9P1EG79_CUSEU|nr:unnamed protein product [Cuscuta europaea]